MAHGKERKKQKKTIRRELRNGTIAEFSWPARTGRRKIKITVEEDVVVDVRKAAKRA